MGSFSEVVRSWPVQLGLVVVMTLGACWVMDLFFRALTGDLRRSRRLRRLRRRRPARRRPVVRSRPVEPVRRPLQTVAADLRRLARELALVPTGTPAAHRAGLLAAYDDVLVEAAASLDVPHDLRGAPAGDARELERLRLTGALQDAGLVVRGPGDRG